MSKSFQKYGKEYDNFTSHDKLAQVSSQVDQVRVVMHDNIQNVLSNTEQMEAVEEKTQHLSEQAKAFRSTGRSLRREMWWKNFKVNTEMIMKLMSYLYIYN